MDMDLGKAGWLTALLAEEVARHPGNEPRRPEGEARRSLRGQARQFLHQRLRTSGLVYGTPADEAPAKGRAPEQVLFLAVLRTFTRLGLDVAALTDAPVASRARHLLTLFAALCGDMELAGDIQRSGKGRSDGVPRRLAAKVESELERRAMSLTGDPAYGLVLHNGATYADAQLFGRQAIDCFVTGDFDVRRAQRRLDLAGRRKALLVEVLVALATVERPPNFPTRRAILRQIEDLNLSPRVEAVLRGRVKQAFERTPPLKAIVRAVRSEDMRRFILEQTLLASLVDGKRSPRELEFIRELGAALGFSEADRFTVEVAMAEFYAANRSVVDVFTVSAGAGLMGEELMDGLQRTVEKNFQRLMQEIRETGELSVLLARAARGQSLTAEERQRMRDQLIDVAKAIPALAIFAAPGGLILLIALAKVMPFNLLPSAFQDAPLPTADGVLPSGEPGGQQLTVVPAPGKQSDN